MSSTLSRRQHPTLELPVTDVERDRCVDYLQQAYADGRLEVDELDQRLAGVLTARTRQEMAAPFAGLAHIPVAPASVSRPLFDTSAQGRTGRHLAAAAHFSGLASWVVGPAVVYACSPKDSYARGEAARAFNWQVLASLLALVAEIGVVGKLNDPVQAVVAMVWLLGTIVGGIWALHGEGRRNPLQRMVPLRILDEGRQSPRALGR